MTRYRDTRKIDPTRGPRTGDNTPNDQDRIEIGPTRLAYHEWAAAGLELPDLQALRRFRWERLTRHIVARGYGGLLMFDPLNIRYATDTTNMQLWNTHNPFRAVLLLADGYMMYLDPSQPPTNQVLFATYFGGAAYDWVTGIELIGGNLIAFAGQTLFGPRNAEARRA